MDSTTAGPARPRFDSRVALREAVRGFLSRAVVSTAAELRDNTRMALALDLDTLAVARARRMPDAEVFALRTRTLGLVHQMKRLGLGAEPAVAAAEGALNRLMGRPTFPRRTAGTGVASLDRAMREAEGGHMPAPHASAGFPGRFELPEEVA